jgi:hypothetical protein
MLRTVNPACSRDLRSRSPSVKSNVCTMVFPFLVTAFRTG